MLYFALCLGQAKLLLSKFDFCKAPFAALLLQRLAKPSAA